MDSAKTKFLYQISLFFLFMFGMSISHASEVLTSAESCPEAAKSLVMLSCDSYPQSTNYTCGPAAVMTLLRYYKMLNEKDMNQKTELRIANEMGATDQGTSLSQVETWLGDHGFQVDSGINVSTDTLIENIRKGNPVFIGFSNHWVLAKGYTKGSTPDKDQIAFADSCCSVRFMSRDTIDSMWMEAQRSPNQCSGNTGVYIIATPVSAQS